MARVSSKPHCFGLWRREGAEWGSQGKPWFRTGTGGRGGRGVEDDWSGSGKGGGLFYHHSILLVQPRENATD